MHSELEECVRRTWSEGSKKEDESVKFEANSKSTNFEVPTDHVIPVSLTPFCGPYLHMAIYLPLL